MRKEKDIISDLNELAKGLKQLAGDDDKINISYQDLGSRIGWNPMKTKRMLNRLEGLNKINLIPGKGRIPSEVSIIDFSDVASTGYKLPVNDFSVAAQVVRGSTIISKHRVDEMIDKIKSQYKDISRLEKELEIQKKENTKLEKRISFLEEKSELGKEGNKSLEAKIDRVLSLGDNEAD